MSVGPEGGVEDAVVGILRDISGKRSIEPHQFIGRDIGIYGGDGVEVLYALEERFSIDLDPFVQSKSWRLPPNWWDRLRGRSHGPQVADCTVRELVDHIRSQLGVRSET